MGVLTYFDHLDNVSQFSNLEYHVKKLVFLCLSARKSFHGDQEKPNKHMKTRINYTKKYEEEKQRQTKHKDKHITYLSDEKT